MRRERRAPSACATTGASHTAAQVAFDLLVDGQNAAFESVADDIGLGTEAQLVHEIGPVGFHRAGADEQSRVPLGQFGGHRPKVS